MNHLKIDPFKMTRELSEFQQRIEKVQKVLKEIPSVDVEPTAYKVIFRKDKLSLRHYATEKKRSSTPLLICYALVNRPYMLDLEEERSFIKTLLAHGTDIYLIDWGYPDDADRYLDLDDYINDYLDHSVEAALNHSGAEKINLMGICQGGTFSLCYTALHPKNILNLVTMVTPVDFQTPDNLLYHLSKKINIGLAVSTYGNIPGKMLCNFYNSLMPMKLGLQKHLEMSEQLECIDKATSFLRMEQWINDSPDQAGQAFQEFVEQFFQQNKLIKGEAMIGDLRVDLKQINHPVLNVFGQHDHLVPPSSSKALKNYISSNDYQELQFNTGHIGIFVSEKSKDSVAPSIFQWLNDRDL